LSAIALSIPGGRSSFCAPKIIEAECSGNMKPVVMPVAERVAHLPMLAFRYASSAFMFLRRIL
jgi:hypothetical protein